MPETFACAKTQSFAVSSKLSKEVINWFISGGCPDYSDVSIGADDAADARKTYADPLISKGLLKADIPGDAVSINFFGYSAMTNTSWTANPRQEQLRSRRR